MTVAAAANGTVGFQLEMPRDDSLIGGPGGDEMVVTNGQDTCQQDGDQAETPCGDD